MNIRLSAARRSVFLASAFLASISAPGRAEDANHTRIGPTIGSAQGAHQTGTYVSIVTRPSGEPLLMVSYPWKRHARPSIEIQELEGKEPNDGQMTPLFFLHDIMKGKVTQAVYLCQDRGAEVPQTATFSQDDIDFEAFGARNSFDRPSVCVACRTKPDPSGPETTARAIFCLLNAWATDQRSLFLELPRSYFTKPGLIRVWFLAGKDILWTQVVEWPGHGP